MSARRRPPGELRTEGLNMTPMIDIVFQLLIFFMLSMRFRDVEGKLLSQLPKDRGQAPAASLPVTVKEVRIVLCGGDAAGHRANRAAHEEQVKPSDECRVLVGDEELGSLFRSEKFPDRLKENREICRRLGARTRQLYDLVPASAGAPGEQARRPPVVLDADSETPYEHVIGVVNACREEGIDNVEFAANPRHQKYLPTPPKGPGPAKK